MGTIQLLIVCGTILWLTAIISSRRRPVKGIVFDGLAAGQEVAVHLADGQSVRGVIAACDDGYLSLNGASLLSEGKETKLGGTARIPRERVALLQEL